MFRGVWAQDSTGSVASSGSETSGTSGPVDPTTGRSWEQFRSVGFWPGDAGFWV